MRVIAALVAIVSVACAEGGSTPTPTPIATGSAPISVDWGRLGDLEPIEADGWTFVDCEGDALLVCVERGGEPAGLVELLLFDRETFGAELSDVDAIAADNIRSSMQDRTPSCPPGHDFEATDVARRTVAGLDGRRTEWTVTDDSGAVVERVATYLALDDERVIVFGVNAISEAACIAREGAEFLPDVLADALPVLDRLVAGSSLPSGTT